MTYNFDEIIDRRHTNALNMDGFRGYIFHAGPEKVFAFKDEEFVRMWVADMEFAVAPEILDALRARIDRRIFGYTGLYDDEYYRTFSKWCRDHYDWSFPKEQLCVSPGIIPALYQLTETLCGPDEKVLLNTPAYGYFLHAAEYAGVDVLTSPLHKKADGTFEVDYEDFERKCADPACKLVFWCNPHNPTGRMWTEEELHRVAAIIEKYNLWVVSDEIHCDLIRCGRATSRWQRSWIAIPSSSPAWRLPRPLTWRGLRFPISSSAIRRCAPVFRSATSCSAWSTPCR